MDKKISHIKLYAAMTSGSEAEVVSGEGNVVRGETTWGEGIRVSNLVSISHLSQIGKGDRVTPTLTFGDSLSHVSVAHLVILGFLFRIK